MPMPDFDEAVCQFMKDAVQYDAAQKRKEGKTTREEYASKVGKAVVEKGTMTLAGEAVSHLAPLTNAAVQFGSLSLTVNPVMWATKPWLAARDVAKVAFELERLYAVMNEDGGVWARKYGCAEAYVCTCHLRQKQGLVFWDPMRLARYGVETRERTHKNCQGIRDFVKNQKDAKAARIGATVSVVTVPFYLLYAAGRSIYKRAAGTIHQDRAQHAQHLVRSATPALKRDGDDVLITERGCRLAQALIALLCGELNLRDPKSGVDQYPKTMSALVHPDGWDKVASGMSASVLFDAGHGRTKN